MKRWIQWTATGVGVLVVLAAGAAFTGLQLAERKMARKIEVTVQ
ncbi:MAG: cytochrome c, partial [Haliea sp.]